MTYTTRVERENLKREITQTSTIVLQSHSKLPVPSAVFWDKIAMDYAGTIGFLVIHDFLVIRLLAEA